MIDSLALRSILYLGCIYVGYYILKCIRSVVYIYRCRSRVNQLPGLPVTPILGNIKQIPRPIDERFFPFTLKNVEQFPKAFHLQANPLQAACFVCHPETVKAIIKTTEPKNILAGGPYKTIIPWIGEGLLIASGKKWFRNRRLLTPGFHFDILKNYVLVYNECADILINKWKEHADSGKVFDLYTDIGLCSLNVIMRCAFSCEEDVQRLGTSHPYVDAVSAISATTVQRVFTPWKHVDWLYGLTSEAKRYTQLCDYVHEVADDVIKKRKIYLAEHKEEVMKKEKRDFLDILLTATDDSGRGMSDLEIRNEVDTFLFEGHDTTASAISWILYCLAKHTDIQRAAQQEVDQLYDSVDGDAIAWEHLSQIPFLTRCIKEGLRLFSPVPLVARYLEHSLVIDNIELLPGTIITIYLYGLHHNPEVWGDDHMEYKPERFLPDQVAARDSYAFCPFAAGPRNCIGQNFAMDEIKTVVIKLLRRYELELDRESQPAPLIVTRPIDGINVRLKERIIQTA